LIVIRSLSNFKFVLSFYTVCIYAYVSTWKLEAVNWRIGVCIGFCSFWVRQYHVNIRLMNWSQNYFVHIQVRALEI